VDLNHQLENLALGQGGDFYGVADLTPANSFVMDQGGADIASYPRCISIGVGLLHTIVDRLPLRSQPAVAFSYWNHSYEVVNRRLDLIALRLAAHLEKNGFRALPVHASVTVDDTRLLGSFSHKLGAHLAGLGWIGKSCLLVTPQRGPRVRWASVLTDAPLPPTGEILPQACGFCNLCVEICPVEAFAGRAFLPAEPREMRYDASKCKVYLDKLAEKDKEMGVCGMCLYVCPYGHQEEDEE
jgi:epoxyqueuosine reductase